MSDQRMYNVASLAAYWGVSDTLVYTLLKNGKLRGLRVGPKVMRIKAEWVLAFEEEHMTRPTQTLEPDIFGLRAVRMRTHIRELRARQRLARLAVQQS